MITRTQGIRAFQSFSFSFSFHHPLSAPTAATSTKVRLFDWPWQFPFELLHLGHHENGRLARSTSNRDLQHDFHRCHLSYAWNIWVCTMYYYLQFRRGMLIQEIERWEYLHTSKVEIALLRRQLPLQWSMVSIMIFILSLVYDFCSDIASSAFLLCRSDILSRNPYSIVSVSLQRTVTCVHIGF